MKKVNETKRIGVDTFDSISGECCEKDGVAMNHEFEAVSRVEAIVQFEGSIVQ